MNFFGPSSTHSFSKNYDNSITNDSKRSSSVPYNSPRVSQLPPNSFNFNVIPSISHDNNNNNNNVLSQKVTSNQNDTSTVLDRNLNFTATNNENPTRSLNGNNNTNQLQTLILKHEDQPQENQINNNNNDGGNTSSNFYAITQYILQAYFKVNINDLPALKLVDLIVDQTYTDSLTLRKLNDSSSFQSYEYFNTVPRDADISRCPIFALSVYFVIRWSHPTQPIAINNFNEIPLLESSLISLDASSEIHVQNQTNVNNRTGKLARAQNFEPSKKLINIVFPWLPAFRHDMLTVDRTNYKLHSLCELFEFMGKVLIQDLKHLTQSPLLLPNIVSFISKFIPDLFNQDEFQRGDISQQNENNLLQNNAYNNSLINSDLSMIGIGDANSGNGVTKEQVANLVDSHLTELSKKLTTENIRLSQQITQLKYDLGSLNSMCNQILQVQKQLLSGATNNNTSSQLPNNTIMNTANNLQGGGNSGNSTGGIIILDRNSINSNILNNLVQSFDHNHAEQSPANNPQMDNGTSALAPIGYINSTNSGASFSNQPTPSNQQLPSISNTQSIVQQDISNTNNKRKLPVPLSALQPTVSSPFGLSPGGSTRPYTDPDSPYNTNNNNNNNNNNGNTSNVNKRFRLDERPTASQAALDSLLYKAIPSPKLPENMFNTSGSRNGSTQINASNFSVSNESDAQQQSDNILPNPGTSVNLLTSKIATPIERDNLTMLSPIPEPMDQIMSNKLDRSYLQNENAIEISKKRPGPIEGKSLTADRSAAKIQPLGNKSMVTKINGPSPIETAQIIETTAGKKTDELPTRLPTITNTFRKSAQLTIGSPPNSLIRERQSATISQPTLKPQGPKINAIKDKKDTEIAKTGGPNESIKYKLSRDNKTIWDLYAEWYIGLNGKQSIKKLIEEYGWRRWKVSEDSHFFPTRRIIIDYIEMEVDRGIRLGRFKNPDQPREDIRKILVSDLEKFRINNVLTLNSLSLYFRYMTKRGQEICIFQDFKNWNVRIMTEEEKTKSCRRSHLPAALNNIDSNLNSNTSSAKSEKVKNLLAENTSEKNPIMPSKISPNSSSGTIPNNTNDNSTILPNEKELELLRNKSKMVDLITQTNRNPIHGNPSETVADTPQQSSISKEQDGANSEEPTGNTIINKEVDKIKATTGTQQSQTTLTEAGKGHSDNISSTHPESVAP
ncbi:similar to Saccharomyces cerevisiae YPL075W GCR1 Transcriptional activator of genes involved in glycolysis [Maudiozyma saulgeensis]|uniref:Similar to Saccharomyces cerevisiae YPL075W GCR1 Transcriptional activator of genes involved in glycolysis n=1 Tax=Maudiozyma saulgeensis TaxID=1789683 RepID=A0A1X7R6F2_9SACH|nr:similar to Saccharomyces cerevisiae YPL075W GCR1 Transcriptional activator of genes involved in glycolysis [Kazachstania saulgeensis]